MQLFQSKILNLSIISVSVALTEANQHRMMLINTKLVTFENVSCIKSIFYKKNELKLFPMRKKNLKNQFET